jgi:uncharacterized RDD family membrane protein YckC
MACPLCGDLCSCSGAGDLASERDAIRILPEQVEDLGTRGIAVGQAVMSDPGFYRSSDTSNWRHEVSSRLRAHRRRRGYDPDASLSLGFAPPEPELPPPAAMAAEFVPEPVEPPPLPPAPSRYQRIAMNRRQAQLESGVLIEFPRPQNFDLFPEDLELAEPLPSLPRILEAPEPELLVTAESTPVLSTIELDTAAPAEDDYEPVSLELPLQVAPFSPRTVSALIDGALALTGSALFAVVVVTFCRFTPEGKLALTLGTVLCVFFWAAYQYLFLVYAGATPGMQVAQLELTSFEGCVPTRRTRVQRALALMLSCASLGMGFFWSLFDEDSLGWHDRITRTYLRQH